ncbi:YCF48-related protein [Thalassotalea psychrophila]|uniref:YCF48-related protein n=1 Tax=Thalassotalea psychrophila TaxID=3065647 RepID=A0ABY9TNJ9_9GAMM|nr:YCF48-related protein [Colwelliaceae bacterium SQ149]
MIYPKISSLSKRLRNPNVYFLFACVGIFCSTLAYAQGDALNETSVISARAEHSLIMDISKTETKLIAVGERGHIVIQQSGQKKWSQVQVPVRVTLTSTFFIDDQNGWAVGHDGVVLSTTDGGQQWQKLLDGDTVNKMMIGYAEQLVENILNEIAVANEEEIDELNERLENFQYFVDDSYAFGDEGASRPFLDVWFNNKNEGFIVGAYGLILRTTDAGKSWTPWTEKLNNMDGFHLNAINQIGDDLYIAAEAGTLFHSTDKGQTWNSLESPYEGSFFGIVGHQDQTLIAFGLRGNAFISHNKGNQWLKIETGVDSSLYGGHKLNAEHFVLVGASGVILHINNQGEVIKSETSKFKLPLSSVVFNDATNGKDSTLVISGLAGIQSISQENKG